MTSDAWWARTCSRLVATTAAIVLYRGEAELFSESKEAASTAELACPLGKLDVAGCRSLCGWLLDPISGRLLRKSLLMP